MKTSARCLLACTCLLLLACLPACSDGGMSDAQTLSLAGLVGEIDTIYNNSGAAPYEDADLFVKHMLAMDEKHLAAVKAHMASHSYPAEVQQHLTSLRDGLAKRVEIQTNWVEAGVHRETAPADEVSAMDDAAMASTEAETQLRIAAGL